MISHKKVLAIDHISLLKHLFLIIFMQEIEITRGPVRSITLHSLIYGPTLYLCH